MTQPQRASQTVTWALVFGVVIGVVMLAAAGLQGTRPALGVTVLVRLTAFIVYVIIFLVAGILAARATGKVASGTLAGLFAGLIGGFIGALVTVVAIANRGAAAVGAVGPRRLAGRPEVLVIVALIVVVFVVLFYAGVGAGVGALGGLIGRAGRTPPPQPYQESMYQGIPASYPPPGSASTSTPSAPPMGQWPQSPPPTAE